MFVRLSEYPIASNAAASVTFAIIFLCLARTINKSSRLISSSACQLVSAAWLVCFSIASFSIAFGLNHADRLQAGYANRELVEDLRPVLEVFGEVISLQLFRHDDRVAGHDFASAEAAEHLALAATEHHTVGAHEVDVGLFAVASRAAGLAEIIVDAQARLVEQSILVVDRKSTRLNSSHQ